MPYVIASASESTLIDSFGAAALRKSIRGFDAYCGTGGGCRNTCFLSVFIIVLKLQVLKMNN
jgi:hypothetical protein